MSGFSMHGEKESASAFALKRARRIAAICIAAPGRVQLQQHLDQNR